MKHKKYGNGVVSIVLFIFGLVGIVIWWYFNDSNSVHLSQMIERYGLPTLKEDGLSCVPNDYNRGIGTPMISKVMYVPGQGAYVPNVAIVGKGCCNGLPAVDGNNSIKCESPERCKYAGGELDWTNEPCTCRGVTCNINSVTGIRDEYISGLCYYRCPENMHRDGIGCKLDTCGPGYREIAGVCWGCPENMEETSGMCSKKCESGWTSDGYFCRSPNRTTYKQQIAKEYEVVKTPVPSFNRDSVYEGGEYEITTC